MFFAVVDSAGVHYGYRVVRMGIYGENLTRAVAQQLQAERAAAGMTYAQLAEASGVNEQSITRYLTGKRDFKIEVLGQLADALSLTPQTILARAIERI